MDSFLAHYGSLVTSVLSGFDRLVFRGVLQPLMADRGMHVLLANAGVKLLDFKPFALKTSESIKSAVFGMADQLDRPRRYLESPKTSKQDVARELADKHPLDRPGLVCVLSAVEPCLSFEYHRSPNPQERGLKPRTRKCLHLYQYWQHPTFGFMHIRIQSWFPFNIQVCLNGREWLARQLQLRHSEFKRVDNCFTWLHNPTLAQRLMNDQLLLAWPIVVQDIARDINPLHDQIFACWPMDYYWSAYQTEWATDIAFKDPKALAAIYPALMRHAVHHFQSPDVMRFLGRKVHGNFTGELTSSFKLRPEGTRIKHWVRGNSIKMYDKAGSVLRVETTIGQPHDFKVFRPAHDEPNGKLEWKPLRKGVADLHRRAEVSQRSNERYLDALAAADDSTPCARLFDAVSRPVIHDGKRYRALRIGNLDDLSILQAIARGEFATAGFRNRDLRVRLYPLSSQAPASERRRHSASISRRLRILRAHGLIRKVQKTHRYMLTKRGQLLTSALQATREATIKQLLETAA
jgi:hypothetical protein